MQIRSCADAVFHAFSRRGRFARRLFAGVSRVTRLRADAGRIGDRILQRGRCWNARHCFWKNTANESIFSAIRSVTTATTAAAVAVVSATDWAAIPTAGTRLRIAAGLSLIDDVESEPDWRLPTTLGFFLDVGRGGFRAGGRVRK